MCYSKNKMRKVKCKIQVTDSSFLISHFFASGSLVQPASPPPPLSSQIRFGLVSGFLVQSAIPIILS